MKNIPDIYLEEFFQQQTGLIKSRIQLAGMLFVSTFFMGTVISNFFLGQASSFHQLLTWLFSISICVMAFILARKIFTIRQAKLSAFLFMTMVLAVLVRYYALESAAPFNVAMVFIFAFFGFSLMFPWFPKEIFAVLLLHCCAFGLYLFGLGTYIFKDNTIIIEVPDYLQGFVIMFLSFWVCFVVSKGERQREIENFVLLKNTESQNKQIQQELDLATRVHKTLIPKSLSSDLVDIAVMYLPVSYMGGDYAKFHFVDKLKLIFIICDVTGHGVPAALLVNRLHTEFERSARAGKPPGVLLKQLDDFIIKDFAGTNMLLSAFCGLLDFKEKKLNYSNHGHPDQYIYKISNSALSNLSSQGSLLGLPFRDENVYQQEINFDKGDRILLFTDGVTETRNRDNHEYGKDRLEEFIKQNHDLPVEAFNQKLLDEINKFKHGNFQDDVFILNLHIKKTKASILSFLEL
ncbi:PP2C family protein-serine/threonine phosphatase [Candidatus Omnitrophota bacterium]